MPARELSLMSAFLSHLPKLLDIGDRYTRRILEEYGAQFVTTATPPPVAVFASAAEVELFQQSLDIATADFDGVPVVLQRTALDALLQARQAAALAGLSLAPRGLDASMRTWGDSEALWLGRVTKAAEHWAAAGRFTAAEATALLALGGDQQVRRVLELEARGLWFSSAFDKTILRSVAAPGTSQHLSLLAFDVADFADARLRGLLPQFGWHQTVISDLPHFTYLGRAVDELPAVGLRRQSMTVGTETYEFWVPELGEFTWDHSTRDIQAG